MLSTAAAYNLADGTSKRFSVPIVQDVCNSDQTLPERFIRSENERPSLTNSASQSGIPVIDMDLLLGKNGCSGEEMEKLAVACEAWGFFLVVNHGIPGSLIERTRETAREFFQLPSEEKLKYAVQEREGYGQAFVVSDDQQLDWTDLLYLTLMPPEKRNMKFWPTIPAEFLQTVEEYAVELQKLGNKILHLLAKNLGLQSPDCFVNQFAEISEAMHYYPPCPQPDLVLGLSAHSDGGGIAILLQDDVVTGLHVRKDGEWIPAEPIPGGLVVNIGDMIEVISNGKYKSIEHRAVTNKEKGRISVAAFCNLGEEAEVGPAAELINELNPCKYRTFKRSEYLRNYFSSKLEGKNAIEFAKFNSSTFG